MPTDDTLRSTQSDLYGFLRLRHELVWRVITTTTVVLLALIAAKPWIAESLRGSWMVRAVLAGVPLLLACHAILWLWSLRRAYNEQARAVASVQARLGLFDEVQGDSVLPQAWESYGQDTSVRFRLRRLENVLMAQLFVGALALLTAALLVWSPSEDVGDGLAIGGTPSGLDVQSLTVQADEVHIPPAEVSVRFDAVTIEPEELSVEAADVNVQAGEVNLDVANLASPFDDAKAMSAVAFAAGSGAAAGATVGAAIQTAPELMGQPLGKAFDVLDKLVVPLASKVAVGVLGKLIDDFLKAEKDSSDGCATECPGPAGDQGPQGGKTMGLTLDLEGCEVVVGTDEVGSMVTVKMKYEARPMSAFGLGHAAAAEKGAALSQQLDAGGQQQEDMLIADATGAYGETLLMRLSQAEISLRVRRGDGTAQVFPMTPEQAQQFAQALADEAQH